MKAIDIIKALAYCKPESGDGVIEYDSETSWIKDSNEFLDKSLDLANLLVANSLRAHGITSMMKN